MCEVILDVFTPDDVSLIMSHWGMCHSLVSWSVVTAAVKPTPDDPLPVVVTARGAVWRTYL